MEEQHFRSTNSESSGYETTFFRRQGVKLQNKRRKRGRKYSSSRASGTTFLSQHTNKKLKKHQNSSDANIVEQPKLKKKKTPPQVARDCARQKAYWKNFNVAKKLRPKEKICVFPVTSPKKLG